MTLSRRHFLTISAAATAALATPVGAATSARARWQGRALGAGASMQIAGLETAEAAPIFAAVEAEITRLERIFSLYRPDSELVQLNRDGLLRQPSPELLDVLSLSTTLHRLSDGMFDPTVQPHWLARAEGRAAAAPVGLQHLRFDSSEARFTQAGMGLTLNGIAQGAITDRIAALLRRHGLRDVLVDIGEIHASGNRPEGTGWRAGIRDLDGTVVQHLQLKDRALATSAPLAMQIGPDRTQPHIQGPNGEQPLHRLVSISADSAALADGLSTACCLLPRGGIEQLLQKLPEARLEAIA